MALPLPLTMAVLAAWSLLAQEPPAFGAQNPEPVAAVAEAWLASPQTDRDELERTVQNLLADRESCVAWLAKNLAATAAASESDAAAQTRRKGVRSLATHVTLAVVDRELKRELVFAGQYEPLRPLQPFVGELLFTLLLDTPDWFPHTQRLRLIAPLRDLQATSPDLEHVERVVAVVENRELEPEDLRIALEAMLWQWGRKEFVQPHLDALRRATGEGDAEDRLAALLRLATLQYQLRDYKSAAATHRTIQAMAKSAGLPLLPFDQYSAACVFALAGDVDRGIAALERFAAAQALADESQRIKRAAFAADPELAALRRDPRFDAIAVRVLGADRPNEDRPAPRDPPR